MILAPLVLASALERPELLAVRCEPVAGGAALKLLTTAPIDGAQTEKRGDELVLSFPANRNAAVPLPQPIAPLRALAFEAEEPLARLRVSLEPGATFEVRSDGTLLTLTFRQPGAERLGSRDVEQLYPLLFPQASEPGALASPAAPSAGAEPEERSRGLHAGPFELSPSLAIRYIDAESTFLDTPEPVHVTYVEIQPQISVATDVAGGRLNLTYGPRFRQGEDGIPVLTRPSHFVSAQFDRSLGSSLQMSIGDQFARGGIETLVVDPGREYFYDLGYFKRNQVGLSLRKETGGRIGVSASGFVAHETIDPGTGYFSNQRQGAGAGLNYELTPVLRASLSYQFDRVPPAADRPLVESNAHSVILGLDGEIGPTLRGSLGVGYQVQDNPQALAGGDHYEGLVVSASLGRQFASGGQVSLSASRATQLSAFEDNAFYVANGVSAQLTWPLPFAFQAGAGAGYYRNGYRLDAATLDEPRRDEIVSWGIGLGRVLTGWSSLRFDYSAERRDSNVRSLSTRTHSLVMQLTLAPNRIR